MTRTRTALALATTLALLASGTGCGMAYKTWYHESGSGAAIDQFTYVSRPFEPKTVSLIDTNTNETLWTVDIPVGKQLTMRFYPDKGQTNSTVPDLMRWDIQDEGTKFRTLTNTMMVPPAGVRRVDVELRPIPENASAN